MATLVGTSGPDIIFGTSADDTLTGGLGADQLIGGGGNDRYVDTAAGLNGDTVVGLNVGDHIIITDANFATFSLSLSGSTLNYTGGSLTLANAQSGYLVVNAAAGGGVDIHVVTTVGHDGDFNGDGRADVLWRNENGTISDWLGTASGGFSINDGTALTQVSTDWHIIGRGDFNGDGK
ncbi:MAG: FG-GAP-like repeat-containing protein, partial [Sphingomonadales bacterium]|nr:FG-GAP-like repeat-containing protein [Sphingomonadales bacterium]